MVEPACGKEEIEMEEINICRFVPTNSTDEQIHVINFVYETKYRAKTENKIDTCYKMAYVVEGNGMIICRGKKEEVKKGDVFFVFPSAPYTMTGDEDFKFIYISFIGARGNMIMEQLHITVRNFVFSGYEEQSALWLDAVTNCVQFSEFSAQGVLFYMFSKIGSDVLREEENVNVTDIVYKMKLVKKYIDDHFADSTLSLETISREFSYNKKYLSSAFKQQFKIGISEYMTTVRINHACVLMEQNYTSVKDIAFLCGFSEQMYFSRVFRKKMGVSTKEHMKTLS